MSNTELKKNAEGYADPTAAVTLNKPESGDIWTYDGNLCLIFKNYGDFSTILLLVSNTGMDPSSIQIETATCGVKWTDPRRLTYGKNFKMRRYVETLSPADFEYIAGLVEDALQLDFVNESMPCMSEALAERERLLKENEFLRDQLDLMTGLHKNAVDRVNKVTFAKLKVENQLELLQNMIGTVLARFQVDTEEED